MGFGLLSPLFLVALPVAIGGLIYAYLKHGRGIQVPVSTLLLLREFKNKTSARSKFRPPIRFFLELLLLSILALGAAGLYQTGTARRIAIVLDNSLSMGAIDPKSSDPETLLAGALERATAYVDSLSSTALVEVFATSPRFRSLTGELVSPSNAIRSIGEVSLGYGSDNIDTVLGKLSESGRYDLVSAFTDKSLEGDRPLVHVTSLRESGSNKELSNVAISKAIIRRTAEGSGSEIAVSVGVYSSKKSYFDVILSGYDNSGGKKEVSRQVLTVEQPGNKELLFPTSAQHSLYEVTLEERAAQKDGATDSLSLDNSAWISRERGGESLLLVGDIGPERLGLEKLRSFSFQYMKPEEYLGKKESEISAQGIIFHRFTPEVFPKRNALFVLPPEGSSLIHLGAPKTGAQVTRWQTSHPLTSYLNLPALSFREVRPIEPPNWGSEIIATNEGAVLVAGEVDRSRFAALGFEILPYEGKGSPVVSILTLNILKWLTDAALGSGSEQVGGRIKLGASARSVKQIDGKVIEINENEGDRFVTVNEPGIVVIDNGSEPSEARSVNFFSEEESDIRAPHQIIIPPGRLSTSAVKSSEDAAPLGSIIAELAALILIIDLAIMLFRPRRAA